MPISEEQFARLQKTQPYDASRPKPQAPGEEPAAGAKPQEQKPTGGIQEHGGQKTGFVEGVTEFVKAGLLSPVDLAQGIQNAGISQGPGSPLFYPAVASKLYQGALQYIEQTKPGTVPEVMDPQRFRSNVVDQQKIDNADFITSFFGVFAEGAISNIIMPGGGIEKVVKPGTKVVEEAVKKAATPIRAAADEMMRKGVVGAGAAEVGKVGRWIMGGLGDLGGRIFGSIVGGPEEEQKYGQAGREKGETIGEIGGSAVGGQFNVMRVKGTGVAAKKVGEVGMGAARATVGSVLPAVKEVIAAKRLGDERAATQIFMSHYSALRAKSMGMMQESTNRKFADIISHDPERDPELAKFVDALTRTEAPEDLWSIGQRAGNRTLTQIEIQQRLTKEGAAAADAQKKAQKKAIITSYEQITDKALPTGTLAVQTSAEFYRAATDAQLRGIAKNTRELKEGIPNWNPKQSATEGKRLRELRDQEHAARKVEDDKNYQDAYNLADANGTRVTLAPVSKEVKDILQPLISRIHTDTVPESIRALNNLLMREGKVPPKLKAGANPVAPVVNHSLKQVDDVVKLFNQDAHDARVAENYTEAKNLQRIHDALVAEINKQVHPDAAAAYNKAQTEFRDKTVPRFRHDVAYRLDRAASLSRRGREDIPDEHVVSAYLHHGKGLVESMEQFEATFGGNHGAPKNQEAYKILGDGIANEYSKAVLAKGFTPEKHAAFMEKWSPALDQSPKTRAALERDAQKFDANNKSSESLVQHYKDVMGGAITDTIGAAQMEQMLIHGLKDASIMGKILASPIGNTPIKAQSFVKELMMHAHPFKGDKYDASTLEKLLDTGEHRVGEPSSMQLLFNKAFGEEGGAEHMANLKAIAELMKREKMTDSSYMRFQNQGGKGPVEAGSGQSGASWLSLYYASKSGRIGVPHATVVATGRFINNTVAKATEEAVQRATYDPEMAKIILEMAQTPSNHPLSGAVWRTILKGTDGTAKFIKDLSDHGLIKDNVARGAMVGVTEGQKEKDKPKKPQRVLDLPR
jgi:hypothetical protein